MLSNIGNRDGIVELCHMATMCISKEKEFGEEEQQQQLPNHKRTGILVFGNGEAITTMW